MKAIVIRPLTPELNADYLDFFDHRAFTDNNPNGPCYCTSPNQSEEEIQQMVGEFKSYGVKETLRRYAAEITWPMTEIRRSAGAMRQIWRVTPGLFRHLRRISPAGKRYRLFALKSPRNIGGWG